MLLQMILRQTPLLAPVEGSPSNAAAAAAASAAAAAAALLTPAGAVGT